MLFSVVVPTYNEERVSDLVEMLSSLEVQEYTDFEAVIVVEKSKKLFSLIENYLNQASFTHQAIFSPELRGISYARNLGVKHAKGEIIAFTDDDAVLPRNFTRNLAASYRKHPEAIGVTGQAFPLWMDKSQSWFPTELHWMIGCTTWRRWTSERATNVSSGVNMSFWREAFSKVGFREDMGGGASKDGKLGFPNEDNEFARELTAKTGRPIIFDPNVVVLHKVYPSRLNLRYVRRYAFWQGCAEARYSENYLLTGNRNSMQVQVVSAILTNSLRTSYLSKKSSRRNMMGVTLSVIAYFALGFLSYKARMYDKIQSRI